MASLPYFFVFTVLTFNKPFEELEVSYLCESHEKVNQWLKIGGRLKLKDLLINPNYFFGISTLTRRLKLIRVFCMQNVLHEIA